MLEGGEGSGKSTQARLLAERLQHHPSVREVVQSFEPGATPRGAKIRSLLLDDETEIDERTELLLMVADRAQHCAEVIRPALTRGAVIVCDRFEPSSLAYQGVGRGLGVETVALASAFSRGEIVPDLVIVFDVPHEVGMLRRPTAQDRIEKAGTEFHERVRAAYRDLAPERNWFVVDGSGTQEVVHALAWDLVAPRLADHFKASDE